MMKASGKYSNSVSFNNKKDKRGSKAPKILQINILFIFFLILQLLNPATAFAAAEPQSKFVSAEGGPAGFLFLYQVNGSYYAYDPALNTRVEIGPRTDWDRNMLLPGRPYGIQNPGDYPGIAITDGYAFLGGVVSADHNSLIYAENTYDSEKETYLAEYKLWYVDLSQNSRALLADNSSPSFPAKVLYPVLYDAAKGVIYFESYDAASTEPFSGIFAFDINARAFRPVSLTGADYNSRLWVSPDNRYIAATGIPAGSAQDTLLQFAKATTLLVWDADQGVFQSIQTEGGAQVLPQGWITSANLAVLKGSSEQTISPALSVPEATSGFQRPMTNDHYGFTWLEWTAGYTPLVYHPGDDYNGPGDDCYTDILAVGTGIVRDVNLGGWGTVVVEHNWQGTTVYSQYGHLSSSLVSIGDTVQKGQHIAEMGNTGTASCHLHWEIRQSDHPNPTSSGYYTTAVLNVKSNVENYYYDPEWWVDNHGSYNNSCNNPSPNADQVGLYTGANYCGTAKIFGQGEWANPGAMGFPNDAAASVKVGGNVKAVLCRDDNYAGGCDEFTGDDPDLTNNNIGTATSSLKVQSRGTSSGSWTANYYDTIDRWWDNNNGNNFKCSENVGGPNLDKNYGTSGPCGMDGDTWIADYSGTINFPAGNYVFLFDHDDGLKFWLNGQNIADYGGSGSNDKACPARYVSGNANLRAMLREDGGDARVKVWWTTDTSACVQPPGAPSLISPDNNATVGRYDNVTLYWNGVSGATEYLAEFSGGPGFAVNSNWTGSTSYNVGSTFWGGVYTWKVTARNSAGPGAPSETRTLYRKYGSPSGLSASNVTQTQVVLSWSASADAPGNIDGYRIYRSGSALNTVGSSTTTYADTGLSCGSSYSYYVKAYKGGLESDASETVSVVTNVCSAGVPSLVSPADGAVFDEGQAVTLEWTDTGDEFYGQISGGPALSTFGWQSSTSKNIGSQWAGYAYTWKVMARNAAGESGYSSPKTFIVRPGQPTNLTASATACGRVNLSWSDNSGSEQGYQVYRNSGLIATLPSNATSYQDNSVASETSYTYTVSAYRGTIQSPASGSAGVTTAFCPPSNDSLSSPTSVGSLPYTTTQSTRGATLEANEPVYPIGSNDSASVWFRFQPAAAGIYSVDTFGSGYDTVLHVFEKGTTGGLTLIQGDDDDPLQDITQSKLLFTGKSGSTYLISVTHYGAGSGGSLKFNMAQVSCAATSICLTATNPWYRPITNNAQIYSDATGGVWFDLDDYGFATIENASAGPYTITVAGTSVFKTVEGVQGPGYLGITTANLPTVAVTLKDLHGTPVDAQVTFGNNNASFFVGTAYANDPLVVFASPGDYTVNLTNDDLNYLTYHHYTVQAGSNLTPDIYDVSQSPALIYNYHVQTVPNVELTGWSGSVGIGVNVNDGETAVVSFPADVMVWAANYVIMNDSTLAWYYEFQLGFLQIEEFRQQEEMNIGGSLQVAVEPVEAPYGRGDTAQIRYYIKDGFENHVNSIWTQRLSAQAASPSTAPVFLKNGKNMYAGTWAELSRPQLTSAALVPDENMISSTVELYSPAYVMQFQETKNQWGGTTNWAIPADAAIGTWTAHVMINFLGVWQGQTLGANTFAVKNTPPPSNDDFNAPIIIGQAPFTTSQDTFGATQAADDPTMPKCSLDRAQATVWYRYKPTLSGTLRADTKGSDYDTILAVFSGSRGSLTLVECNDDRSFTPHDQDSELVASLTAGTNYYIMIGKFNGFVSPNALNSAAKKQPAGILTMGAGTMQLHLEYTVGIPGAAQLLSPNSTLVIRRPAFIWSPGANATRYKVRIKDGAGKIVYEKWLDAMDICTADRCTLSLENGLANGDYTWQVLSSNAAGDGPWSTTLTFKIQAPIDDFFVYLPNLSR